MKIIDSRYGFNQPLTAKFLRYENGQTAIVLSTPENDPWLTATVAVSEGLPAGCVAVKDWSENEGVPGLLVQAGLIEAGPVQHIRSGFVAIPVYHLTAAARTEIRP